MLNGFNNNRVWSNQTSSIDNMPKTPTWGETIGASIKSAGSPIVNHISNSYKFNHVRDENFQLDIDMFEPRHYEYVGDYVDVQSQAELDAKLEDLDGLLENRETLYRAGVVKAMISEFANPINWLGLTWGIGEARLMYAIGKVATASAFHQGGLELLRAPFDPTSVPHETPINIGAAFVFGGFLQGGLRVPSAIKARNHNILMDDYNAMIDGLNGLTPDDIDKMPSVKDRKYGLQSTKELNNLKNRSNSKQEIFDLNREISVRRMEYWKSKDPNDIYKADNFFVKAMPTPFRSFLRSKLTTTKSYMHRLASDHGLVTVANMMGLTHGPSIYTQQKLRVGPVVKNMKQFYRLWGEEQGGAMEMAGYRLSNAGAKASKLNPLQKNKMTFDDWITEVNTARLADDPAYSMSPKQKEAADLIDNFFKDAEVELRQLGLIGSAKSVGDSIKRIETGIKTSKRKLKIATKPALRKHFEKQIIRLEERLKEQELLLKESYTGSVMPKGETKYFSRYWNQGKIKANRQIFKDRLVNHYSKNPKDGFSPEINDVELRAEDTIKKILEEGEYDPLNPDTLFLGLGSSKHTRGRILDIPNKDVLDFIELNPEKVMLEYTNRIAPLIEWEKGFGGRTLDDILDEIDEDGISNNMSVRQINKARMEFQIMYNRVVGRTIEDPSRLDSKVAYAIKEASALSYLGSAGFATISEPAAMFMNHEVGTVFKSLFNILKRPQNVQQALRETKEVYAEALEIEIGNAQVRFTDEMRGESKITKTWEKGKDAFYTLNGLAPLTALLKNWESLNRQHSIIDYSIKLVNGNSNKFETTWLLRNGIDKEKAIEIANAPWDKTDNGLYLANISKWKTKKGKSNKPSKFVQEDTITSFKAAMSDGILNTILMGTPADKPILADGIMMLPMHIAGKMGLKEHPKYRGYARVESGLLNMPLQFYSYLMAAATKIQGSMAQGQNKNKAITIAMFMGLGYLQYQMRVPDYVREKDNISTALMRSFDYAGLGGVYSDTFYTALHTGMELTGKNFTGGMVAAKYGAEQNYADALAGILGAGPDIALQYSRAAGNIVQGNYGEGTEDFLRILPFLRLWFLKDEMRELGRTFGNM